MSLLEDLLDDLDAESERLRALVVDLDDDGWRTATPAAGWSVATQVAHLLWTDEVAALAARAHVDQATWDAVVLAALADPEGFVDTAALELAGLRPDDLLARWDDARRDLADALRALPEGTRMPWFGPPMSASSMVTARFMETWAHSLDVHEALDVTMPADDRLRHVAHLGVRTRGFAFAANEQEAPVAEVRVELVAPDGSTWSWGADDAPERVTGPALDFCRLVTQRVHRSDTALVADGPGANAWLDLAQCFAGPPGGGRAPVGTQATGGGGR